MKINPVVTTASVTNMSFTALSRPEMHSDMSRGMGPLSDKDVKMIEAATNTRFTGPRAKAKEPLRQRSIWE